MTVDKFILETTKALVQIDSRNPELTPDALGEAEVGHYIAKVLNDLGLEPKLYDLGQNRVNIVATLEGTGNGSSLILNGHLDTVGTEGMDSPYAATEKEGRLYGRGAQDMKASLAAMLGVAKALVDAGQPLKGDLILSFVADEEAKSIGTEAFLKDYTADAAIITEPTDLNLCSAHRGFIWYEFETFGRAAHGSRYKEGVDANMMMGHLLIALDDLGNELLSRAAHPLAGPASLHAALLEGGTEASTYAAHAKLLLERRTIPGETTLQINNEFEQIITGLTESREHFKASFKPTFERYPFEISKDAAIVKTLETATAKQLGQPPEYIGGSFWTDAALFAEAGIDTVLIGPVGEGLHSKEEWVDMNSVYDLAAILLNTVLEFCQT